MIAGAYHWTAGSMTEAHLECGTLELLEPFRWHVTHYRQMTDAGLKVLPDRKHLDVMFPQVPHYIEDFLIGFPQTQHQTRLSGNFRKTSFEILQQFERMGIIRARAALPVEPRNSFQIMVQHVRRAC